MKTILALMFCLGLALPELAHANDQDKGKHKKQNTGQAAVQRSAGTGRHAQQMQRNLATKQARQSYRSNQAHSRQLQVHKNQNAAAANARVRNQQSKHNQAAINAQKHQANQIANANHKHQANQANKIANANRRHQANRNFHIRNRNSFADARRHNWHNRHDRGWWRHHYNRFALFGGGYYYWNNNYWYPAYGYDPVYTTYAYDEPIYGYNELAPGQVIVNVQTELQREGYYNGGVDGLLGPMTRDALARYQSDNGLVVTQAIDEPTLEALGLV